MTQQEQVLKVVSMNGPLLPAKVAKAMGTNILFASAMLSELASSKKIKISNTKIDGSPVYYVPGQESKLQDLYEHINDKDKQAFDMLKEKKVMNDEDLVPLAKASMRALKDFAIPLNVQNNGQKFLFWKWYLVPDNEAEGIIRSKFVDPEIEKKKAEEARLVEEEKIAKEKALEEERLAKELEEKAAKEIEEKKKIEEEKIARDKEIQAQKDEIDKVRAEQERILQEQKADIEKQKLEIEKQRELFEKEKAELVKKKEEEPKEEQKTLEKKKEVPTDEFFKQLNSYFNDKNIGIVESKIVRKNAEIDFMLKVPSVVGSLDYYCKAKNKKKVSDTDLSSAFVQGQLKKLPSMILVTGELTKKAKDLMKTEFSKNLVVQRIE